MRLYHLGLLLITLASLFFYFLFKGNLRESEKRLTRTRQGEHNSIFFLKTHKCGSSTVQNIILRFGFIRSLSFVLPSSSNYLGHPTPFKDKMIPNELALQTHKYNIFTHHTRYNSTSIRNVMESHALFVTILRNPVSLFESLFSYYDLRRFYGADLPTVLRIFPSSHTKHKYRYYDGKLGVNQMSFDLGLDQIYFNDTKNIIQFIDRIHREFDLVMISEHMEASLILLCDIMNWPLSYVQFVSLNKRAPEKRTYLSPREQRGILEINRADAFLYMHFLKEFQNRIKNYGIRKMIENVKELIRLNNRLYRRCVDNINYTGYANTTGYEIKDKNDWLCIYATKNELNFTEEIRDFQKKKVESLERLIKLTLGKSGMI